MTNAQVGTLATWLGLATAGFGVVPLLSPRFFSRLCGLNPGTDPTVAAAFRSVGARDLAIGLGIWSAAAHGGNSAPWLLVRAVCDGGDAIACAIAIGAGARNARFLALTFLAAGAAIADAYLYQQARDRAASQPYDSPAVLPFRLPFGAQRAARGVERM